MERETLTDYLKDCIGNVERLRSGFFGMRVDALQDAVNKLSDPDLVRVVRCRDCKHSKRMCQPWNDLICDKHGGANMPDWYCADGERDGCA